ncbi:MAG: site-2 protease family protein [Acidobacteria bacterium]|nr:site-2 protease family protein [Acidobacteriota bacterium]
MGNIDVGFIIIWFVALLFSLSFHEAAHAWTSEKFGDDTGRLQGRITLNPLPHIDPIGTVVFPLISAITSIPLLGWAKPVQTNPLLWRNKTKANISVSAAGPISNFILALLAFIILAILLSAGVFIFNYDYRGNVYKVFAAAPNQSTFMEPIGRLLNIMLVLNLSLGFFNLLPIPPLDGSHVMESLLPEPMADAYAQIRPYGIFLLLALMYMGVLSFITTPIIYVLKFLLTLT